MHQDAIGTGRSSNREQVVAERRSLMWANVEEPQMPVFIMWAVPAVIVIGGVSYYLIRAVH